MKTNTPIFVGLCTIWASVFLSCSELEPVAISDAMTYTTETVFTQSNAILSFTNEEEFLSLVNLIRNGESRYTIQTRSSSAENFISLYDEFEQAMAEADEYYQRNGGYEEFKVKFPNLFYPEYGEDYAAFLPVSDEAVAKLLNQQGKVIIGGEEKDLRDVWSYERILELGLGMPDEMASLSPETKAVTDIVTLTESQQVVNAKRKAWVKLRGITVDEPGFTAKLGRIDLCFRKKGILGWYNGKMKSESYIETGEARPPLLNAPRSYYMWGAMDKHSPHKYLIATRPIGYTSHYGTETFFFECDADDPTYSFTGKITTNIDNLLDMNNGVSFWEELVDLFNGNLPQIVVGINF